MAVVLAFVLAYVFSLIIGFGLHEWSHAFTAYKMGDPTPKVLGRLTLNPLKHVDGLGMVSFLLIGFGWAKPVQVNPMNFKNYKRGMFLVSISGIFTNLLLAFVFSGAYYLFVTNCAIGFSNGAYTYSNALMYFFHFLFEYSIIINITMFIFNLMPIFPLDGFNIIRSFCKYDNKFISFMYRYGTLILIFVLISPIFDILYSLISGNILQIFFNFWGIFG